MQLIQSRRSGGEGSRLEHHPHHCDLAAFNVAPLGHDGRRRDARVQVIPRDHVRPVNERFVHDDIGLHLRQAADGLLIRVGVVEAIDRASEIESVVQHGSHQGEIVVLPGVEVGLDDSAGVSSTVEITLHADGDGTIVGLRHDRLPTDVSREQHAVGWRHYVERLAVVVT